MRTMILKKTACLLTLALLVSFPQPCKCETAKSDPNARLAAQNKTSPRPDSQQPNETVVPAPSTFREVFDGTIGEKHYIYMMLERKDADLTGRYFYERAGAFKVFEKKALELKGRVDGDGNVALTETSDETGNPQKTGEFKGKLDGLSAKGAVRLRGSGLWTAGKDGKQMPFSLRQRVFNLCGLKLDAVADKSAKATAKRLCGGRQAYNDIDDEIIGANKDFISALSRYEHLGSLHPYTTSKSFNYDLNRKTTVRLADLFKPNSNYLKVISVYCVRELEKLETDDIDGQIERGAGPELENFHSWNITPAGLKITFDPYQVGPYVDGPYEVVVPYSVLKPIIKPDGLLAQFVR